MIRMARFAFVGMVVLSLVAAAFQASQLPVGTWMLDEASGTVAADASGTSNGTRIGSPTPLASPLPLLSTNTAASRALSFDGSGNQYVEIPNVPALENIQEG